MSKPTESDHLVWIGRFQPFHIGHMDFLAGIADRFENKIFLGIIATQEAENSGTYGSVASAQNVAAKNPLTIWERVELIRLSVQEEPFFQRLSVSGIPRPDINWAVTQSFYPPKRVLVFSDKDEFEDLKAKHWSERGERVVRVPTSALASGSEFKQAMRDGKPWQPFLAKAAHDFFASIDGPERFRRSV